MEAKLKAVVVQNVLARQLSGQIDGEAKKQKLLKAYAEEFSRRFPKWENLQVSLAARA